MNSTEGRVSSVSPVRSIKLHNIKNVVPATRRFSMNLYWLVNTNPTINIPQKAFEYWKTACKFRQFGVWLRIRIHCGYWIRIRFFCKSPALVLNGQYRTDDVFQYGSYTVVQACLNTDDGKSLAVPTMWPADIVKSMRPSNGCRVTNVVFVSINQEWINHSENFPFGF